MAAHCLNSEQTPVKPVAAWENEAANGMALCIDFAYQTETAKIDALRARQADYLKSLPTAPEDCLNEARRVLHKGGDTYPEGFEEAFYLSFALGPMIRCIETGVPGPDRAAILYVADRIQSGLMSFAPRIEQVADILGNPARLERDARIAKNVEAT